MNRPETVKTSSPGMLKALVQAIRHILFRSKSRSPAGPSTSKLKPSVHRSDRLQLETLEPRLLLSADLLGSAAAGQLAGTHVPGDTMSVVMTVRNAGNTGVNAPVQINLYASPDATLGSDDPLIGSAVISSSQLGANASRTITVPLNLTGLGAPGSYNVIGNIDPANQIAESSETNNLVSVPGTLTIAWSFGNVPGHAGNAVLTLTDGDGTQVKFSLTGPGRGDVIQTPAGFDISLSGTSASSQVTLQTKGGDGRTTLRNLTIAGTLGSFTAPKADLTGDIQVTGTLNSLTLGNIADNHRIDILGTNGSGLTFVAGQVKDLSIHSASKITALRVTDWQDSNQDDVIVAPTIGLLTSQGDFAPSLTLSGAGATSYTLNTATIGGTITGGLWNIQGKANLITARSTGPGWQASITQSLQVLLTSGDLSGILAVPAVQLITVGGTLRNATLYAGASLGSDGKIGGSNSAADNFQTGLLANLWVRGNVIDSQVRVGDDPVDGIFDNGNDQLVSGSRINSLIVGGALQGTTHIVSPLFPQWVWIGGVRLNPLTQPLLSTTPLNIIETPTVTLALQHDTGAAANDQITTDPTVAGTVSGSGTVAHLYVGVDSANPANWVDMIGRLQPDNSFILDRSTLEQVSNGPLADGTHTVYIQSTDTNNSSSNLATLTFLLDTARPDAPTLTLDSASDSGDSDSDGLTNDATPTLNVTGEAGSTLVIKQDDVTLTPTIAGPGGQITVSLLADGSYAFDTTATDVAGNFSENSGLLAVTIDTTPPATPVFDLTPDSDSDVAGDHTTNAAIVTVRGATEPNAAVELLALSLSTTADSTGTFQFDNLALALGANAFTARATDVAGNQSSYALTIERIAETVPDTIAPILTAALANDSGISATDALTNDPAMVGSASDDRETVVLKAGLDAALLNDYSDISGEIEADGSFTLTTSLLNQLAGGTLADGTHTLHLIATDGTGNTTSTDVSFTLDTTGPDAPTLTLDSASDSGVSDSDGLTNDATPTLNVSGEAGSTLVIKQDSVILTPTIAGPGGQVTVSPLADGSYAFSATATDVAGNISDASSLVTVTLDTAPPATPVFDLAVASDSGTLGDHLTNAGTVTMQGTTEPNATITLLPLNVTATADGAGLFQFSNVALAEGDNVFTAQARDAAGNLSSYALTIRRDSTAPTLMAALGNDTGTSNLDAITTDPAIVGTVQDSGGTVQLTAGLDGTAVNAYTDISAQVQANGSFQLTTTVLNQLAGGTLSDGTHTLHLIATDAAGNTTSTEVSFTLDTARPDAPTLTLASASDSGASDSDRLTNDTTPTLNVTGEAGSTLVIKQDGVALSQTVTGPGGQVTVSQLADGSYAFSATATDAAGNVSDASSLVTVTIDTAPPATPVFDLAAASDSGTLGDHLTNASAVTLQGTTDANASVTLLPLNVTTTADGAGVFQFANLNLSEGDNAFTAQARDAAGNLSSYALTIRRDSTAPTLTAALGNDTGASNLDAITTDPTIVGTVQDSGGTIQLTAGLDGTAVNAYTDLSGQIQANGSFQLTTAVLNQLAGGTLSDGTHTLHLIAIDGAGNTTSTEVSFTLDASAPAIPVFDLAPASDTDTVGDQSTSAENVTLQGLTEPDAIVTLLPLNLSTTADATGAFRFDTVALVLGANAFTAQATDIAGNTSSYARTLTRTSVTPTDDTAAPTLSAALANDTGANTSDGITHDATITGTAKDETDGSGLATLTGGLDGAAVFAYANLTAQVLANGTFTLTPALLNTLAGGTLAEGAHTLHLIATDNFGNTTTTDVSFTLDTLAPSGVSFGIAPADALNGDDSQTAASKVLLLGQTDPGATVRLIAQGLVTLASQTGSFQLPDVVLATGDNTLTLTITDGAGNAITASRTLTRVAQSSADPVLEWNNIALQAIQRDVTDPPVATRILAMQSIAVYDTLAAIQGTPAYLVQLSVSGPVSADAAVIEAAYRVLYQLYPAQRAALDSALAASLSRVADGAAKDAGLALGRSIADAVLAIRANDGYLNYAIDDGSTAVGQWRPTGPMYLVSDNPQWGQVIPFALTAGDEFRALAPPALDSAEYAAALAQVQSLGAANSATRTADQTQQALFWADGGGSYTPPGHWNQIAAQVAQAQGNSLSANARLMAMLNVALADAAIACWDTKYTYDYWRPITAIQNADADGNAATIQDADWQPLLLTPPHPTYVSGHSTFSAAAADILASIFGDNTSFSTTSATLPGVTRSYTSFSQAADEAGISRIYGGIHTSLDNEAGKQIGTQVGDAVLARFAITGDTQAPVVVADATPAAINTNLTLTGQILDNLSGVAGAQYRIDNGNLQDLALDAGGRFSLTTAFNLDGSQDGAHTITIFAHDAAGNISTGFIRSFTLDTQAPTIDLASLAEGVTLNAASRATGTVNPTGSSIVSFNYSIGGGTTTALSFDAVTGAFDQVLVLGDLAIGNHALTLTAQDAAGNTATLTRTVTMDELAPFTLIKITPSHGSTDVGTTFRPQVYFSRAVNPATLTADTLYATGPDGARLDATIVPALDGSFAWLFFTNPMPGSSTITLHVIGSAIRAAQDGIFLDADRDGADGGDFTYSFTTVSTTTVAGTRLVGKVVDPGADLLPMTFDDIRRGPDGVIHTPDDVFLLPIVNARVFIVGRPDLVTFTDANGDFAFDGVPAGDVKVGIDGRTATNAPAGIFFPEMVMAANLKPGITNTLMGSMGTLEAQQDNADRTEVYLPRVQTSALQQVSDSAPTTITVDQQSAPNLTDEQRSVLTLTVKPGSAIGFDGKPLTDVQIGINTVPPELVKDMLPPGVLGHTFDITIQAPGVDTFAQALQITFPNVFNAAPGTKLDILSFDHTTGMLVITGTGTVSADGLTVVSDPDSGVLAPGWHGVTPPGGCAGSGGKPPEPVPPDADEEIVFNGEALDTIYGDSAGSTVFKKTFKAPPQNSNAKPLPPIQGCEVPPHNPSSNQQPFINVTIEIDGPLKDFVKQSGDLGLDGVSFTLSPGSEARTFSISAQSYAEMFGSSGGFAALERDRLYGSQIKITTIEQKADGTRERTVDIYYLYRWVDVVDAPLANNLAGNTAAFMRTNTDGVVRHKDVDMYLGKTPTQFIGSTDPFDLSGTYSGRTRATWLFDPEVAGGFSATFDISVNDPDVGLLQASGFNARGDATDPTTVSVNLPGFEAELLRVLREGLVYVTNFGDDDHPGVAGVDDNDINGIDDLTEVGFPGSGDKRVLYYDYGGGVAEQFTAYGPGLFGTVNLADDFAQLEEVSDQFKAEFAGFMPDDLYTLEDLDAKIHQVALAVEAAVKADYAGVRGITVVPFNDDAPVTMTWVEELIDSTNVRYLGEADEVDLDTGVASFVATSNVVLGTAAKAYALANALNLHITNTGKFTIASQVDFNGSTTFAEALAQTVSHEIGHTFGLNESYLAAAGFGEPVPPNDLMGPGSAAAMDFASTNVTLLQAAVGTEPDGGSSLKAALAMVQTNWNLPNSMIGIQVKLGEKAADLGVRAGDQNLLPGASLDVGSVAADGADGALLSIPLTLTNLGQLPLSLSAVSLAGGNAEFRILDNVAGTVLDPNASTTLTVVFDPATLGPAQDTLTITSNARSGPAYVVRLSGAAFSAVPRAVIETSGNNFGGSVPGSATVQRQNIFTIRNDGAQPLVISDISLAEGGNRFGLIGVPANLGSSPINLARGESFSFGASFAADQLGLQRGIINVVTSDPLQQNLRLAVTGTGVTTLPTVAWGKDYFAIANPLAPDVQALRTVSDAGGNFSFFLPSQQPYHLVGFDPATGLVTHGYGTTAPSGRGTDLTATLVFNASTASDSDFDGLPDDIEFAVGTSANSRDTNKDGLDDFTAIQQGLDPLSGVSLPTGIVSATALNGTAQAVALAGSTADPTTLTAYVATGGYGLAVVDVSKFTNPEVLAQIDLGGSNTGVAVDASRNIAAVASTAALHLVDISTPSAPTLTRTVTFPSLVARVVMHEGLAFVATGTNVAVVNIVTGDILQTLNLSLSGGGTLTDLAFDGDTLFTMDANYRLSSISLVVETLASHGALDLTKPPGILVGRIFVGGGIAYVEAGNGTTGGYMTVDVSNPGAMTLIAGVENNGIAGTAMALNGSGLGVAVGSSNPVVGVGYKALDVLNVADPANTSNFLTRINLPGVPNDVALANGIAFVADGASGLQIVNYLALDINGVPPAVSITIDAVDRDAATAGIQVLEGDIIHVTPTVTDDVQVRNVELLVNGKVVANDVAFPFDLVARAPTIAEGGNTLTVQVRATDTGGNITLSSVMALDVLPDTFPPQLLSMSIDNGASLFFLRSINLYFDESIDVARLTNAGVSLLRDGGDGTFGTADDVVIGVRLDTRNLSQSFSVVIEGLLAAGNYRFTLDPTIVSDYAGNQLEAPVVRDFTIRAASGIRATSGTPEVLTALSANPGQTFAIAVPFNPTTARADFSVSNSTTGVVSTQAGLAPQAVDAARGLAYFTVPFAAMTGDVVVYSLVGGVRTDFSDGIFPLQIVPVITDVRVATITSTTVTLLIDGFGFIEANGSEYRIGSGVTVDTDANTGPNVTGSASNLNDSVSLTVPLNDGTFGPVSVRTAGGTSASYVVSLNAIQAVAFSGTPANPAEASANPGQAIRLFGTGLSTNTDVLFRKPGDAGFVKPIAAAADGTSATLIVPANFFGGFGTYTLQTLGSASQSLLQILPAVSPAASPIVPVATLTQVIASVTRGTPAAAAQPAANAGDVIELVGTNFGPGTRVLIPLRDTTGKVSVVSQAPLVVNAEGTRLQVRMPGLATTGDIRVVNLGSGNFAFGSARDAVHRNVTLDFTAGASDATIHFADGGLQGLADESWGIDNVVVRQGETVVFADDFEGGASANWSDPRTDVFFASTSIGRFSGRFSNDVGQVLNLTGLTPGESYNLTFDLLALDSWEGAATGITAGFGPDLFIVSVDGVTRLLETVSNSADVSGAQSFRASDGLRLQVVPTLTAISGRPGETGVYTLTGSGFMEGASTVTIGGVALVDTLDYDLVDVSGSDSIITGLNNTITARTPRTLEGPVRVTTAGGFAEIMPGFDPQAIRSFTGIVASAPLGVAANPAASSANTGQTILLQGGGFTGSNLIQFQGVDDNGVLGTLTRAIGFTASNGGLLIEVPALARTGPVTVLGSGTSVNLQVVPVLRAVGGTVAAGNTIMLEGTGLTPNDLVISIDGRAVGTFSVRTVLDGSGVGGDQQFVTLTVPNGVGAGVITVATAGGQSVLRTGVTVLDLGTTPGTDASTLANALDSGLAGDSRIVLTGAIGTGAATSSDVDMYRVQLATGSHLRIGVTSADLNSRIRIFNAAGTQLATTTYGLNATNVLDFTAPLAGLYYVGISGSTNTAYNPNVEGSGIAADAGSYQLRLESQLAGSSRLIAITGTAVSGTPLQPGVASANTGQSITLSGVGLTAADRVVFTTLDDAGVFGSVTVTPTGFNLAAQTLTVTVPANATTGQVRLAQDVPNAGLVLQIVPTISDASIVDAGFPFPNGYITITLTGSGFAENATTALLGGVRMDDHDLLALGSGNNSVEISVTNTRMTFIMPSLPATTGLIRISTVGGTSAALDIGFTGIIGSAASGTPADSTVASANPGDTITLLGSHFDSTTDVIFEVADGSTSGNVAPLRARPTAVNAAGTEAQVSVPINAVTGVVRVVGSATTVPLQILPVILDVRVESIDAVANTAQVLITGLGFVEGRDSEYLFGSTVVRDWTTTGAGVDVVSRPDAVLGTVFNGSVRLTVPLGDGFFGPVRVRTTGGISAEFVRTLSSITATAASGTPANGDLASANPVQAIVLNGTNLTATTGVLFRVMDQSGNVSWRLVNPTTVTGTTQLTVVVPQDAITGVVQIVGDELNLGIVLQIVPTITDMQVQSVATDGSSAVVVITGLGFVEGSNSEYRFGSETILDTGVNTGPEVNGRSDPVLGFVANGSVTVTVPLSAGAFGAISVKTAGGASASYSVSLSSITGTALSGTPANAAEASANAGQAITLNGSGLSTSTDVLLRYVNIDGTMAMVQLSPSVAAVDGTSATLVIPHNANGAFTLQVFGSSSQPLLQIVPTLTSFDTQSSTYTLLYGSGFVEAASSYSFAGASLTDTPVDDDNTIDVYYTADFTAQNGSVYLNRTALPTHGLGDVVLTTAGGTSAPLALNTIRVDVAGTSLGDVAVNAAGNLWVSDYTQPGHLLRIDASTGQVLQTITMTDDFGTDSLYNLAGLQVLSAPMTLSATVVPAGSLLVFNGYFTPDRVIAVDPGTGAVIASLALDDNYDLSGATFDPATGHIFLTETNGAVNRIIEISATTGAQLAAITGPFNENVQYWSGLAIDPTTGHLWLGAYLDGSQLVEYRIDGVGVLTELRRIDTHAQGLNESEISGLSFAADGTLYVASMQGEIYRIST